MNKIKAVGLAAAMMVAPLAASAATVVTPGGSYDLLADAYFFDGAFDIGTPDTTLTFSFFNSSDSLAAFTILGGTVLQRTAQFTDGVSVTFGSLGPFEIDQGVDFDGFAGDLLVAAGQTVDLVISFGEVIDDGLMNGRGTADIDFSVEAAVVPVPAAGLLLLTAVGGLALARRRKSA